MHRAAHRIKISTTVAPQTHGYLECLVETGRAASLAEAIDQAVSRAKHAENRDRLERDTAAYFQGLKGPAAAEESRLEAAVADMADEIDFDG